MSSYNFQVAYSVSTLDHLINTYTTALLPLFTNLLKNNLWFNPYLSCLIYFWNFQRLDWF